MRFILFPFSAVVLSKVWCGVHTDVALKETELYRLGMQPNRKHSNKLNAMVEAYWTIPPTTAYQKKDEVYCFTQAGFEPCQVILYKENLRPLQLGEGAYLGSYLIHTLLMQSTVVHLGCVGGHSGTCEAAKQRRMCPHMFRVALDLGIYSMQSNNIKFNGFGTFFEPIRKDAQQAHSMQSPPSLVPSLRQQLNNTSDPQLVDALNSQLSALLNATEKCNAIPLRAHLKPPKPEHVSSGNERATPIKVEHGGNVGANSDAQWQDGLSSPPHVSCCTLLQLLAAT